MNLEKYLEIIKKLDQKLAAYVIVPDLFAEIVFRRSSQTIKNWKKKGNESPLSVINVGNEIYVTATCLIEKLDQQIEIEATIKRKLFERLRQLDAFDKKKSADEITIFYGEAMDWVGMNVKIPADRKDFGYSLGEVSRETWGENKPHFMLSALVVRQDSNMPGGGFYLLAKNLRGKVLPEGKYIDFVNRQIELAWEHAQGAHSDG